MSKFIGGTLLKSLLVGECRKWALAEGGGDLWYGCHKDLKGGLGI
jgi:hypothetical protein